MRRAAMVDPVLDFNGRARARPPSVIDKRCAAGDGTPHSQQVLGLALGRRAHRMAHGQTLDEHIGHRGGIGAAIADVQYAPGRPGMSRHLGRRVGRTAERIGLSGARSARVVDFAVR
jgi:hypothetical protein